MGSSLCITFSEEAIRVFSLLSVVSYPGRIFARCLHSLPLFSFHLLFLAGISFVSPISFCPSALELYSKWTFLQMPPASLNPPHPSFKCLTFYSGLKECLLATYAGPSVTRFCLVNHTWFSYTSLKNSSALYSWFELSCICSLDQLK